MDFAFDDLHGQSIGLDMGRGRFLNVLVIQCFYNAISVFLASLRWLSNNTGVYLVQVSLP